MLYNNFHTLTKRKGKKQAEKQNKETQSIFEGNVWQNLIEIWTNVGWHFHCKICFPKMSWSYIYVKIALFFSYT